MTDRLIRKLLPGGEATSYTYTATNLRESVTDNRGTTTYEYDSSDRLTRRTEPDGVSISHTYDLAGNVLTTTTPGGTTIRIYDAVNRLSTVTNPDGGITRYEYDDAARLTVTIRPNGTIESRTYDLAGRVAEITDRDSTGTMLTRFTYTRTPNGDPQTVTSADGRTVSYSYDADNRLTNETISNGSQAIRSIRYAYDAAGNRIRRTDSLSGTTTYHYNSDDLLLSTTGAESELFTYDASGNTISKVESDQTTTYSWDAEHRLTQATITQENDTNVVTYGYDADGMRVRKTIDGSETRYLLDTTFANPQLQRNMLQTKRSFPITLWPRTHFANDGRKHDILRPR